MKKIIAKSIIFLSILLIVLILLSKVFQPKNNTLEAGAEDKLADGVLAEPENTLDLIVIGESEKDNTKVCGYTENMKLVNIDGPHSIIGKIVNVKITDTKSFSLDGKYIDKLIIKILYYL